MILTMKKMTACIGVLAFAALTPFAKADPVNLVAYSGFEGKSAPVDVSAPTAAWNPTGGAEVVLFQDNEVRTGDFSLKFLSLRDAAGEKKAQQNVTLNSLLTYRLDFHLFGTKITDFNGFAFSSGLLAVFGASETLRTFGLEDLMSETGLDANEEELDVPGWTHFFLDGITVSGAKMTEPIAFSSNGSIIIFLDDVSLICTSENCKLGPPPTNVPEPGTLLLVGAALAAAGVTARRRKQA